MPIRRKLRMQGICFQLCVGISKKECNLYAAGKNTRCRRQLLKKDRHMFYAQLHDGKLTLSGPDASAEIWPSCGALLNSWQVQVKGESIACIDGYESLEEFATKAEWKGFRSCKMSPFVCRLNQGKYAFEGRDYSLGKFYLGESSIHGILYNAPFEVVSTTSDEDHAIAVLRHVYKGDMPGYPFPYEMVVTYLMRAGCQLTLSTTITNLHNDHIPISDGWHPYFSLGAPVNELELKIASNTQVQFNDALIPTGELIPNDAFSTSKLLGTTTLDDCFLLRRPLLDEPACTLTNTAKGLRLTISPDEKYPYLQLYTPPHRNSIAIENLSSAPDAFNNRMGLIIAEPNERISFNTTYKVEAI